MLNYLKSITTAGSTSSSNRLMFLLWNLFIMIFTPVLAFKGLFSSEIGFFFGGVMTIVWGGKVLQHSYEGHNRPKPYDESYGSGVGGYNEYNTKD